MYNHKEYVIKWYSNEFTTNIETGTGITFIAITLTILYSLLYPRQETMSSVLNYLKTKQLCAREFTS